MHPPSSDRFEDTAIAWLFDLVPPNYRLDDVLRRYPVVLARMARQHVDACLEATRHGYATLRVDLREQLPPHAMQAAHAAYEREGHRLTDAARAVALVEDALRGNRPAPKL